MVELSAAKEQAAFEEASHELLGISAAEFRWRWNAGKYRNDPNPDVIEVAMFMRDAW